MSILKGLLQDDQFLVAAGLLSAGSQGQSIGQAAFPAILQAAQIKKADGKRRAEDEDYSIVPSKE